MTGCMGAGVGLGGTSSNAASSGNSALALSCTARRTSSRFTSPSPTLTPSTTTAGNLDMPYFFNMFTSDL